MKSLTSIFVIVVCVGAYFLYIKPTSNEVKLLKIEKSQYDNVLNRVKEIKQKRDAILLEYESISVEEKEKLDKIIPNKLNSVHLANDISSLGSRYGLTLKDIKASESDNNSRESIISTPEEIYKTSKVSMRISGQYSQFIDFLEELESGSSLLDVVALSIKSAGSKDQSTALEYSLEANVYSLR